MPLVKIKTSEEVDLDLEKIYKAIMEIFGTPPTGVQVFHDSGVKMFPPGIFVDMRIKEKEERDAEWMKDAMDKVAAVVGGDNAKNVRVRCEKFQVPALFKKD
eukprot:TRINITY_DN1980_c0_g1_i1.p1 TRINITY_DN1980_c0_g1~~TRINITY_DN1980_c0_g1_i1.p1  ORF type:complete len:102 (+),score=20.96 TRINITY_DN1980_c0_g1_i1:153-458(+)